MSVRVEDLPADVRARVAAAHPDVANSKTKTKTARQATTRGDAGRCSCGEHFDKFTAYEKHRRGTDDPGHGHYRLDLDMAKP